MSYKTSGGGYFLIPAGPSAGTTVAKPGSANTYGSWVEMEDSAPAALFIVGVLVEDIQNSNTYIQVDIGVGAESSEVSVSEVKRGEQQSSGNADLITLPYPIPVAAGVRIACRTAGSTAGADTIAVSLLCINQADLVAITDPGDAVLDEVVEGSYTLRHLVRLMAAALLGELSGAATTTITIRDASDTKTRITATVDEDGNRSALTLDET